MTLALCFKCGNTKFGAICPCPQCGADSVGDVNLDIAFSDHWMSADTIGKFGDVVRTLHGTCDDDNVCFWAFIKYVSDHHPTILKAKVPDEYAIRVQEVLARTPLPTFEVSPGHRRDGFVKDPPQKAGPRKWWRFWK